MLLGVKAEFARMEIDQFKLPGHQCQARLQGIQRLGVQVDLSVGLAEYGMDTVGEPRNSAKRQYIRAVSQDLQRIEQAADGIRIVSDELQMDQAFLGSGEQCLGFDQKFR